MGTALLQGWIKSDIKAQFSVIEPHEITLNVAHFTDIKTAAKTLNKSDTIILAVKPQVMADICSQLKPLIRNDALILSIAAGQSLSTLNHALSPQQPIIRAMPNTPAAIGKGMSVAVANAHVTTAQKTIAETLLKSAGRFEWLDDESLLDAVTALSGSGPAYVFHLIEILSAAGKECGLPEDLAQILARQTVIGAAALAEYEADTPAETLRKNVTSPGGTTEAALKILMDGRAQNIFNEALKSATNRGKQLNAP